MLIIWKVWHQCTFFSVSISFMVIVSWSCLRRRRFLLYGNQPHYEMDFLLDSTSVNAFSQVLLITGIISVGINSISPIIFSIQKVSISCFALKYIFVCSVLFFWVSYLPKLCFIRNTKNDGPLLIFVTYVLKKIQTKTTTV